MKSFKIMPGSALPEAGLFPERVFPRMLFAMPRSVGF
jgi:hypothetical protein